MDMQQLREEFANWAVGEPFQNAFDIMQLLTDPTPITEAGLRDLGFVFDAYTKLWEIGEDGGFYSQSSAMLYCHGSRTKNVRTLGHLRMLLLSVGDQ